MNLYNVVAASEESTVVAQYVAEPSKAEDYQSEADLERAFIEQLGAQGYAYLPLAGEQALIENLRRQLERLNAYTFSDAEWERFFKQSVASASEGIAEKTRKIQTDYVQILRQDDGSSKNIYLLDKKDIHNNSLQVINQYASSEKREARYDVTILVNGLPLVHVELKRRGVAIREAFNQIERYQRDNFWASSGLYEYVQIFLISNGTHTKYYSNTTRLSHVKESSTSAQKGSEKAGHSFAFASSWADASNNAIEDLTGFTKTFLARHTLLRVLTRYCVFTSEQMLLVMRPYQIAATERILSTIEIAHNYKKAGTLEAGGYVWHTTGSGKTLTSFKTAQLASALPYIDKVLFVVDRKDLDYQTMKEYDRFEKGAANSNASTRILQKQLEDNTSSIIITTIQKLDIFVSKNKGHAVFGQSVVIIFDECHRSQFGDMHSKIVKAFKKYYLFGFTGTPIFAKNKAAAASPLRKTTAQAFGAVLHTYTIVDAINDKNVLPFRVEYFHTIRAKEQIADKKVQAIDTEQVLLDPARITKVCAYILENFNQKTKRNSLRALKGERVYGFNSILAVSSISAAKRYYSELKKQLAQENRALTIATIFSYSANEADPEDGLLAEEGDVAGLDQPSRDFLESAIADYNQTFKVNFDTSAEKFQNYYKDVSLRMKNCEIDLLIVVNMFLTGFDAPTLNTLWVDKNLRHHGLIQAFSRTNRILNSVKSYGHIVCFRDLQEQTQEAIALFGDKQAGGTVLLKDYASYYQGFEENGKRQRGYAELIASLTEKFPLGQKILGEERQKAFIDLYGAILRLKNILSAFDAFQGQEILSPRNFQDYQSMYIDLYQDFKADSKDKESIIQDVEFELELIRQVDVNIDYILRLVESFHQSNCQDKNVLVSIDKAVGSSLELRSKKKLITDFVGTINASTQVETDWKTFIQKEKEKDLAALIQKERLKPEETEKFIQNALRAGELKTTGTDLDKILPPVSRFGGANRSAKKQQVADGLRAFFEKYAGVL